MIWQKKNLQLYAVCSSWKKKNYLSVALFWSYLAQLFQLYGGKKMENDYKLSLRKYMWKNGRDLFQGHIMAFDRQTEENHEIPQSG